MENLIAKKVSFVPGLVASMLLLGMTFSSPAVEANTTKASVSGKHLAWWGPGWGYNSGCGFCGQRTYYRPCGSCYRPRCGGFCNRGYW